MAVILAGLTGLFDFLTNSEVSFFLSYTLPIAYSIWFIGKRTGIKIAILCSISWLVTAQSVEHQYSPQASMYWNIIIKFVFYLVLIGLINALSQRLKSEETLGHQTMNLRFFYQKLLLILLNLPQFLKIF